MKKNIKCKDCKHSYPFFKQSKDEKGLLDFIITNRCRLDNKILPDGTPECVNCFEPRIIK